MSDRRGARHPLPDRPNLLHLKNQARDLVRSGEAGTVTRAQFMLARSHGFPSWPKLRAHILGLEAAEDLARAIDQDDVERVKALLTRDPALHRAGIGYGRAGALTRVAECRTPEGPPSKARLDMAAWMIDHGSDVHQEGDAPLGRAALDSARIPMMELLMARGADVNASSHGPVILSPCETVDPVTLKFLLDRGADPNCEAAGWGSALDYLLGSYMRTAALSECIDILLEAGGRTRRGEPAILAMLRRRTADLTLMLQADPGLAHRRFPALDFGASGGRMLTLRGATLLHVAAEFDPTGQMARICLDHGADVNARATLDEAGVGGQTAIFHAVSHGEGWWIGVTRCLLDRGADLAVRARVPGSHERPGEVIDCTPLGYALRFSGAPDSTIVALLRESGGVE